MKSVKILPQTILFNGNLAQPQKYYPLKYLGYMVCHTEELGYNYAYTCKLMVINLQHQLEKSTSA